MPYQRPNPESKKPGKSSSGLQMLVEAEKMIQIAIILPVMALVGWLAGAWLDGKLHQSWIAVVGVLLGGVAGLVYVIVLALMAEKKADQEDGSANGGSFESRDENQRKTE
jgi:Putative F0F1-ATPase subunit Ca2+/Mg2+ transporter